MSAAPVAGKVVPQVSFPGAGVIRIESAGFAGSPDNDFCRRFLQRAMLTPEINAAVIAPDRAPSIDLHFNPKRHGRKSVLDRLATLFSVARPGEGGEHLVISPSATARDWRGVVRYHRLAGRVTGWRMDRARVGSARLHNPVLYRKRVLCEAIERELMSVLGVHRYETCAIKCRVEVEYDPRQISAAQIVEILDGALAGTKHPKKLDKLDRELTICSASVPIAALAQFAAPALMPVSAALFAYTTLPTFKSAYKVLTQERRLGVDVLDSIVVMSCLATGQVLPGSILAWCLCFGRHLVRRTEDNSKKALLGAFGKQPRFVWLLQDGQEIEVSVEKLRKGDIVIVRTGEVVPIDGVIVEGLAMIDQHALTGESSSRREGRRR